LKKCLDSSRNLSNKLTRLEVEGNNPIKSNQEGGPRNPNQFRRPFNPQLCEGKEGMKTNLFNHLFRNNNDNNLLDDVGDEEYVDFQEEMHLLQDETSVIHLTQTNYEKSLVLNNIIWIKT
jgi:hypothetical protein